MKTTAPVIFGNPKNMYFTSYFKSIGEFVSSCRVQKYIDYKPIVNRDYLNFNKLPFLVKEALLLNAKSRENIIRNNINVPYLKEEGFFNSCLHDEIDFYRSLPQHERKDYLGI